MPYITFKSGGKFLPVEFRLVITNIEELTESDDRIFVKCMNSFDHRKVDLCLEVLFRNKHTHTQSSVPHRTRVLESGIGVPEFLW